MLDTTTSVGTLYVRDADQYRAANAEEVLAAAKRALAQRFRRGKSLTSPQDAREYLQLTYGPLEHEMFVVLMLDTRHRLIKVVPMFRGTVDGASVHPREVVKEALACNAAAVVLAHNHPSGECAPSQADELITRRLKDALAIVDIRVLDHIIAAAGEAFSFAERGML